MRLPTSFNDITVSQFQECYFLLKQKPNEEDPFDLNTRWANIIAILSGKSYEEIADLPIPLLKVHMRQLNFLLDDELLNEQVKQFITVNKKAYKAIYEANKLSTAQALDIKTFLKPEPGMSEKDTIVERAHKLLASIYLPLKGTSFEYDGANHEQIAEDFRHAKMGDVWGTLFFYARVYEKLMQAMEPFGNQAIQTVEKHMEEVLEWANGNSSQNTGDGN